MAEGNGNGHHNGDSHYGNHRLLGDLDLAKQFETFVALAEVKGFSEDEIAYGILTAATDFLIERDHPDCCIVQMLIDFMSSYYEAWHDDMAVEEGEDGEQGEVPVDE